MYKRQPERRPLTYRDQLGGLIVSVAQGRQGPILLGKVGQIGHHLKQLLAEIAQPIPVKDQIGVVCDIAAGGPQMDDAGGRRCV